MRGLGRFFSVGVSLSVWLGPAADTKRLQLAMQRRPFHSDKSRRARDISAKSVDLDLQVFSLKLLTGIAQRQANHAFGVKSGIIAG